MQRLRGIDLNLLVVFQLLYELRHTGQVAERLGITQPAVSNALARLRKQLSDELFERTPAGLSPTPYADRIIDVVQTGLFSLETGLSAPENFDPRVSTRTFRIAISGLEQIQILPSLLSHLELNAPNLKIQTVCGSSGSLKADLEQGDIDLAIGFFPQLQAGFYQRRLYEEVYLCLMRRDHPMLQGANTTQRLASFKHLIVEAAESGHAHVERVLRDAGVLDTRRLHVPSFMSAPFIVRDSDFIATLPERFAQVAAAGGEVVATPHPVRIEPSWVSLFWHRRFHRDEGLCWLRQTIADLQQVPDASDEVVIKRLRA